MKQTQHSLFLKVLPHGLIAVALVLAFLAENENRQPEDLLLADFGRFPKAFFVGKDKVNK